MVTCVFFLQTRNLFHIVRCFQVVFLQFRWMWKVFPFGGLSHHCPPLKSTESHDTVVNVNSRHGNFALSMTQSYCELGCVVA